MPSKNPRRTSAALPPLDAVSASVVAVAPGDVRPAKRRKTTDVAQLAEEEKLGNPSKKRGTRKPKAPDVEPVPADYPARTSSLWKVGAHVSAAGGVENAILKAASIGANAFALFVKSQRKWTSPPTRPESVDAFKRRMLAFGYSPTHILPHGSYLVNLGNPDSDKREKSYECFLDELKRCEELGLVLFNFHPGSTVGIASPDESLSLIAGCINRAHAATSTIVVVIENMAGSGNVIGASFAELRAIIDQVNDKSRVGVCLDTCHMFAAGYDIRTREGWNSVLADFDATVGISYLRGMHLNDSKTPLNSKKDRHENLGLGHLGLATFHHILTDFRTRGIPLILETPNHDNEVTIWAREVEVLNRLSNLPSVPPPLPEIAVHDAEKAARDIAEQSSSEAAKLKPDVEAPDVETVLVEWTEELRNVVKSTSDGGKSKKKDRPKKEGSRTKAKRKSKQKAESSEANDDEDDMSDLTDLEEQ